MTEIVGYKRRDRHFEEEDELTKFLKQSEELEQYEEYVPVKVRKQRELQKIQALKNKLNATDEVRNSSAGEESDGGAAIPQRHEDFGPASIDYHDRTSALINVAADLKKQHASMDQRELKQQQQLSSELLLLKEANQVQTNALQSNEEIAQGVKYSEPLVTTWSAPRYLLDQPESVHDATRKKWNIITEGSGCPPPIKTFKEMKLPEAVLKALANKGIARPTPIQVQALPALLSGRDLVGIAFTGSGKTLTFSMPMIMFALEEEMNMPLEAGEGPIGLILAPSRELARQTYEVVDYFLQAIGDYRDHNGRYVYPRLRSTLCIGGEDGRAQIAVAKAQGVHCIVATPGRLNDLLKSGKLNLDICKYMVLDEADRM